MEISGRFIRRSGSAEAGPIPLVSRRRGSHRARLAEVVEPSTGAVIDQVLVLPMLAPRSYTGEDVVEIHCHGGPVVSRLVLAAALAAGARVAEPGEFSERAFLNGRMDLCQAEAVADLIAAESEAAAKIAVEQLRGSLSRAAGDLQSRLTECRALIEAHLDFPEDDLPADLLPELESMISVCRSGGADLAATFARGRLLRDGFRVAILAKPNAGKSTLMNALLGQERALVSAEPGTTRDYLEEPLALGGHRVLLCDTAGVRDGAGPIEAAGIERTRERARAADLVVLLFDGSQPLTDDDALAVGIVGDRPALLVRTKADLPRCWQDCELEPLLSRMNQKSQVDLSGLPLDISAHTGAGIEGLIVAMTNRAREGIEGEPSTAPDAVITRLRHLDALQSADAHLAQAQELLRSAAPLEILASALQVAAADVAAIAGGGSTEEVLDQVFRSFCIGK